MHISYYTYSLFKDSEETIHSAGINAHMNLLGFLHTEKPKKKFFDPPNNQKPKTKKLNKSHLQGFVNSQYFS